jgi:TrmH family RNA methyltransferase
MGSSFRLPISYFSLPDLFVKNAEKAKLPVYASSLSGESLYETPLKGEGFLVLGNESKGVSPILNPFVTQAIRIPGAGKEGGRAESLNVAIATGIICAEFRRLFPLK